LTKEELEKMQAEELRMMKEEHARAQAAQASKPR
jgi:hypothetical protein